MCLIGVVDMGAVDMGAVAATVIHIHRLFFYRQFIGHVLDEWVASDKQQPALFVY